MELIYLATDIKWLLIAYITANHISYVLSTLDSEICSDVDFLGKPNDRKCSLSKICKSNFSITYIETPPFYSLLAEEGEAELLLRVCCGNSTTCGTNIHVNRVHDNINQLSSDDIATSDIVYPIFARDSTSKLYGMYFIPYIRLSKVLYITKKNEDIGLLLKIFDLYPLVVIALLLAVISGFVAWIIETWVNAEEFPRAFLVGWFDGFWWSFVSMTTVGYGDKTPRSILARIFSVIWVLIGLILCGIFTGELTGQIVKANSPVPADMNGANVGVLWYRDYDGYVVSQNGGIVIRSTKMNDFYEDFTELLKLLKNDSINGLAISSDTYFYLEVIIANKTFLQSDSDMQNFFQTQLITTSKVFEGEKFSYGLLVKKDEMYKFLKDFVAEFRFRSQVYTNTAIQIYRRWRKGKKAPITKRSILFSPRSIYFIRASIAIGAMLGAICIFGFLYEVQRKRNLLNVRSKQTNH